MPEFGKESAGSLAASDLAHRYLWGDAVDQLLADEVTNAALNETLFPLTDHSGSVRDIVDDGKKLRKHTKYDAFGGITDEDYFDSSGAAISESNAEAVDQLFGYTGRLWDEATGLQNNLHRWYDADTGRWMSQDPIGFEAGDANLYRYVGNTVTTSVDPNGLWLSWPSWNEYRYYLRHPFGGEDSPPPVSSVSSGSGGLRAGNDGMRRGAFGAPTGRDACDTFQQGRELAGQLLRDTARDAAIEVATAGAGGFFTKVDDVADLAQAAQRARRGAKGILTGGRGFGSFRALKRFIGPAGEGREWHHIVEQSKIGQFTCEHIHNTNNIASVPAGVHGKISAFYSSKPPFTGGTRVRDWLSGKPFDYQWEFGMRQIERLTREMRR